MVSSVGVAELGEGVYPDENRLAQGTGDLVEVPLDGVAGLTFSPPTGPLSAHDLPAPWIAYLNPADHQLWFHDPEFDQSTLQQPPLMSPE